MNDAPYAAELHAAQDFGPLVFEHDHMKQLMSLLPEADYDVALNLCCSDATINTDDTTSDEVILQEEIHSLCDVGTLTRSFQGVHGSSLLSRVCSAIIALPQNRHARVDYTGSDSRDVDSFGSVLECC